MILVIVINPDYLLLINITCLQADNLSLNLALVFLHFMPGLFTFCIKFLEAVVIPFHGEVVAIRLELKLPAFDLSPRSVRFLLPLLKHV